MTAQVSTVPAASRDATTKPTATNYRYKHAVCVPKRTRGQHRGTDARHGVLHPPAPHPGQRPLRVAASVVGRHMRAGQVGGVQRRLVKRAVTTAVHQVGTRQVRRRSQHGHQLAIYGHLGARLRQYADPCLCHDTSPYPRSKVGLQRSTCREAGSDRKRFHLRTSKRACARPARRANVAVGRRSARSPRPPMRYWSYGTGWSP
jgi:hypothetical protein